MDYQSLVRSSDEDRIERMVNVVRVDQLEPGDLVKNYPMEATFIARVTPHPLFPPETGLVLVIWFLHNEGEYSFDALLSMQEVGTREILTVAKRKDGLRKAFRMGGGFGG